MKNKEKDCFFFGVSKVCQPFVRIFLGCGAGKGDLPIARPVPTQTTHTEGTYTYFYWFGTNHDPIIRAAVYSNSPQINRVSFRPTNITKLDRLFLIDENK
jgi:hypothetical protein